VLVLESDEPRSSSSIEECLNETEFSGTEPVNLYKIHPGCTGCFQNIKVGDLKAGVGCWLAGKPRGSFMVGALPSLFEAAAC
jgi:hypothetical protein